MFENEFLNLAKSEKFCTADEKGNSIVVRHVSDHHYINTYTNITECTAPTRGAYCVVVIHMCLAK